MKTVAILFMVSSGWLSGQSYTELLRFPDIEKCEAARVILAPGKSEQLVCIGDVVVR